MPHKDPASAKAYFAAYYQRHKEKYKHRALRQRQESERYKAMQPIAARRSHLRRYGIDAAQYDAMLSQQRGRCAICGGGVSCNKTKYFDVDHDHRTGKVRGLLCRQCNVMLGYIEKLAHNEKLTEQVRRYVGGRVEFQPKAPY